MLALQHGPVHDRCTISRVVEGDCRVGIAMRDRRRTGAVALLALLVAGCSGGGAAGVVTPVGAAPAPLAATVISAAAGPVETRLACQRAANPHCNVRAYQVMVGSFVDGSTAHGPLDGYGPGPHTGDLRGVIRALDHIDGLGVNAIWLTPIFDSAAGAPQQRADGTTSINAKLDGTGYFARDYFRIDPQFGTEQDLRDLVAAARARGIDIILDGVFGHTKGGVVPSPSGLVPAVSTNPADYEGPIAGYPGAVVDYRAPQTRAFFREVATYWMDNFGIAGWRLDQAYQVPNADWRAIRADVEAAAGRIGTNGIMIAEIWRNASDIGKIYGDADGAALASAFDFPTRYALVQALAVEESGARAGASALNAFWSMGAHQTYPVHAMPAMMLGNHDLVRFGDLIERAGYGGPDTDQYWARHRMAATFLAAWSGPVTIYYGDEVGQELQGFAAKEGEGCASRNRCDDHVARAAARIPDVTAPASTFDPRALALRDTFGRLMALRDTVPALATGSRTHLFSDATAYLDLKYQGGTCAVLAMNTGTGARRIELTQAAIPASLSRAPGFDSATVRSGDAAVTRSGASLVFDMPGLSASIVTFGCS
ncbi:MAG: alpha-amylase family glycosyl hydrolase [Hyphomonadaceae bacterium]|jgi:glycosidase|nr:alpha-amylase family glycosyl hydrolase [Hyphomonadaceae bacterium]